MNANTRLSVPGKLAYGLGTLAFGIKDHGFNVLLMLYYNQVIGLPAAWVGMAIFIVMVVDALADPVIGHLSDNLRTRWGRRHPFMYGSALPAALGYFLLWSPPEATQALQFIWLLVTASLVRIAIACYEIPSSALITEFSDDYDERTSLSTYRSLFLAVGAVLAAGLVFKLFLVATPEQAVGQLNAAGYRRYGVAAGLTMMFVILVSAWGTHRRIPTLRLPATPPRPGAGELARKLRTVLLDRAYASVLLCCFLFAIGSGLAITLGVYLKTYFWRLNADQVAQVGFSGGWGVILGIVLAQFAKRYGKKPMTMLMYTLAMFAIVIPPVLRLAGVIPDDPAVVVPCLMTAYAIMVGCVLGGLILGGSMVADVAEHFELKTGERMEGLMFAALVMITKATSGMGVFLSGLVLTAVKFPEKADLASVTPQMSAQLAWICIASIAVFCSAAILALKFYPITRESHAQTLRQLALRKEAASAAS